MAVCQPMAHPIVKTDQTSCTFSVFVSLATKLTLRLQAELRVKYCDCYVGVLDLNT